MEKLSIEEKAKAYDEVVNKLKGFMAQGVDPLITRADVQDFFPELKESEDEKIRKGLIDFVNQYGDDFYGQISKKYAIAWLKKQGEKMSNPRYSILAKLIEADDIYQMSVNASMVKEAKNKAIDALSKLEISKLLGLEKQGEKKHVEWSEEDKDMLRMLLEMINYASDHYQHDDKATDIKAWVLKSLKDRVGCEMNCTTTKEWSEEDEDAIGMAIIALEDMYDEDTPNTTYGGYNLPFNKAAERLKSLKDRVQPQNTWKPSDEQIYELTKAVDYYTSHGFPNKILDELLKQLYNLL